MTSMSNFYTSTPQAYNMKAKQIFNYNIEVLNYITLHYNIVGSLHNIFVLPYKSQCCILARISNLNTESHQLT